MNKTIREIQQIIIDEHRLDDPELAGYSDAEVAMMYPVTPQIVKIFVDLEILKLQQEIDFNNNKMNDQNMFYQERTELRNENLYLYRRIAQLRQEKDLAITLLGGDVNESRSR